VALLIYSYLASAQLEVYFLDEQSFVNTNPILPSVMSLSPPSKEVDDTSSSQHSSTARNSIASQVHVPQDTTPSPSLENEGAPAFQPTRSFMLAFASICIVTLAAALDATSLSIALPIITAKLKGSAIEAFWAGTSFLLTSAVFQPVIAGLSHVFGRKEVGFP
jgi:hypothetical protein